jgi:NAD dependent epimerase/dehydratase family enzyme
MSDILLNGSRISPDKLINSGFRFSYPELKPALKNLLGRS